MSHPRPGLIIVNSRPTSADFTANDLNKWYIDKHIPDVLATGGVQAALWCQLVAAPEQVDEEAPPAPYLAVYYLPDLNWLHKEGCEFWKLSMELDAEDAETGKRRSVLDVAEFSTASWELDEGLQPAGPPPRWPVTPGSDEEKATTQLILVYAEEPTVSFTVPTISASSRIWSLRCRPDPRCPFPPAIGGKNAGEEPIKRWLFCHELAGSPACTNSITGTETLGYTVLEQFGDTKI